MNLSKDQIKTALQRFTDGDLAENAHHLLNTLGYRSQRTLSLEPHTADGFVAHFDPHNAMNRERGLLNDWESIDFLFQLTDDEITLDNQTTFSFEDSGIDNSVYESYLFFALKLRNRDYTRTQLSDITREINKLLMIPAMVLFQYGDAITFAVIDRWLHKLDESKDVLEKVTLIKDIVFANPHRAHIDILFDLSLGELHRQHRFIDFPELHEAWKKTLDTELLNKQFYQNLFNWFGWAVDESRFPEKENRILKPEQHVIRLITRLLFVWFIKEKTLVADELFDESEVAPLLKDYNRNTGDSYYRAVLQNLFFATLNTEIGKRKFSTEKNATHRNFSRYRYKSQISHPDKLLELFAQTPFINGGLFDCLDSEEATEGGGYRIDCFSDRHYKLLSIPNRLFFDEDHGLFPLLKHYKFTVEENTPIEQEVALDPELLGKVFENLLAAYNPETGESARKQTGSYYTPRPIVDYMVEEALVATLAQQVNPSDEDMSLWDERLHYLLDYAKAFDDASEWFDDDEKDGLVRAISELKILDPAVGSGAFPMGVLHKLTLALRRLDPDNWRWEQLQKERAIQRAEVAFDTKDDRTRRLELVEIDETFKRYRDSDFGRKLYLIQNSIFGVDIQSIACQIAKLRFFISLAIEQMPDKDAENFGIKPLPNLETRFVAANTLIGLEGERTLTSPKAKALEQALADNRERHFHATTRPQKLACKREDKKLRRELAAELRHIGMPDDDAERIVHWDPYDQSASTDWFNSEWMFGVKEGFDTVLGNPPYIQLQKDGGKLGRLYEPYEFASFMKTGDIYCLFYEKAKQLSRDGGHVCFITSNKWMRTAYGKKLRNYFIGHTQPVQLLDMGPDVFDATVDTNILMLRNTVPNAHTVFKATTIGSDFDKHTSNITQYLNDNAVAMGLPHKDESWAVLSPAELTLKRKIAEIGKPLKDWDIDIYRGIITGCNEAFFIDEAKRTELIAQDPRSVEIIKPLLRGRDIERYHVKWARLYLLATGYDLDIPNKHPAVYQHLETLGEQIDKSKKRGKGLFNRDDQGENWWNLRACAYYPEFEKEKIVWQEMATKGTFFIDGSKFYSLDTTRIMTGKNLVYLVGILNSRFFLFAFKNYYAGGHLGSKGIRFKSEFMKLFPVPPITEANQYLAAQIEEWVEKIIAAKRGQSRHRHHWT